MVVWEFQNLKILYWNASNAGSWSDEVFVIKDIINTLPLTYNINNLNNKIAGTFYEKKLQKISQKIHEQKINLKEMCYKRQMERLW